MRFRFSGVAQNERTYTKDRAIDADERGTAPVQRRRRGEDGRIDHVLPVARERPAGDDKSPAGIGPATIIYNKHRIRFGELA